jgi:biotin operon repressor
VSEVAAKVAITSLRAVARELGCSHVTVLNYIKSTNIPV